MDLVNSITQDQDFSQECSFRDALELNKLHSNTKNK